MWIGIDAGPPSIHVYDVELKTETGPMPGVPIGADQDPTPGPIYKEKSIQ